MAWRSHGSTNAELVNKLQQHGVISSSRVRDAMLAVDRRDFVRDEDAGVAFLDMPQGIGHGATISAPHMHAHVLQLLEDKLQPGAQVENSCRIQNDMLY